METTTEVEEARPEIQTSIAGLIEGIAETTASLMKLFSDALSDKLEKRKDLAVLGYGLSSIAKPFLYFTGTWEGVLGVRFADRPAKGYALPPKMRF
jgi:hypothetical protein